MATEVMTDARERQELADEVGGAGQRHRGKGHHHEHAEVARHDRGQAASGHSEPGELRRVAHEGLQQLGQKNRRGIEGEAQSKHHGERHAKVPAREDPQVKDGTPLAVYLPQFPGDKTDQADGSERHPYGR